MYQTCVISFLLISWLFAESKGGGEEASSFLEFIVEEEEKDAKKCVHAYNECNSILITKITRERNLCNYFEHN